MGRPSTQSLRRIAALAVVVGLHGLTITLLVELRTPSPLSSPDDFVSTVILPSPLPPPAGPSTQAPRAASDAPPAAAVTPPIALPAQLSPSAGTRTGADWASEAQQAAAAVTLIPKVRGFGTIPAVETPRAGTQRPPGHVPGEQYRTTGGAWVVWLSDRCYLVSEVAPMGVPQPLARFISTGTVCQGDAESRGDLFKDLPAYAKHHPR